MKQDNSRYGVRGWEEMGSPDAADFAALMSAGNTSNSVCRNISSDCCNLAKTAGNTSSQILAHEGTK